MSFFCHWLQQEVLLLSKKFLNLFPELLHSFSFYLSPFWHIKVTLSVLENRNSPHPLTSRPPSLECVWTEVSRHSHHLTCTEYKCRVPQCPICYMGHLHRTTALFIQPCWISSEKSQLWPYFCLPPEKEWRETGKWWGVKTDGSTKSKMCRALRSEQASDRFQHSKQRIADTFCVQFHLLQSIHQLGESWGDLAEFLFPHLLTRIIWPVPQSD